MTMADDPTKMALTDDVIDSMAEASPRFREIMSIVVRHLHAAVREARLTEAEWESGIDFLTSTGQKCNANRQEFILLSDVLGVSMLVDAVNHPSETDATETTVFGPFYTGQQPLLANGASILNAPDSGEPLLVTGCVKGCDGAPIADALVEVWQVASNGYYDVQDSTHSPGHMRGSFKTDMDGHFAFRSVLPVTYAIPHDGPVGELLCAMKRHANRPAHVHFMISALGFQSLVTHLFIAGDPWLERDAVFGVKPSLIVSPTRDAQDLLSVEYEFILSQSGS